MKSFNEWRQDVNQHESPDVLIDKIGDLIHQLEVELDAFQGERFEGFLNIIGSVKNLQRTLAEINHGVVGQTPGFATSEDCGEPHAPRGMKKINHKEVASKGVRKGEKDLSADYKGHIKMNGDVEPFKVMKKGQK